MATVKLIATSPYQTFSCFSGNTYTSAADGSMSVSSNDVRDLLNAGCVYGQNVHRSVTFAAPAAAAAANVVASTALATGALTIAAQPDVPRQVNIVVNATNTVSAGVLTMVYAANDSTTQTDTFNLGTTTLSAGAGTITLTSSKGVVRMTSAAMTNVTTAGTAGIQIGSNAYLAVPLDPGAVSATFLKETKVTNIGTGAAVTADEAVSTATLSPGLISPTTAPNASIWLSFDYQYLVPVY